MLLQTNSETHEKAFCLEIVCGSPSQPKLSLDVKLGLIFQSSVDIACPEDLFISSNEKKLPQSLLQIPTCHGQFAKRTPKNI
jgi:hypothetical protein